MFAVNVTTKRRTPVRRFTTVHTMGCRYARLPMRRYLIDAAEVLRLYARILRGDGGVVRLCKNCRPQWAVSRMEDAT